MIVQHINSVFLEVKPSDYEVFLDKRNFLENKKVDYILSFYPAVSSTYNEIPLFDGSNLKNSYIDIHIKDYKNDFIKNFNLSTLCDDSCLRKKVGNFLDFDLTKISLMQSSTEKCYLPLIIIYESNVNTPFIKPCNKIKIDLKVNQSGVYKLSQFSKYCLNGKKIKQILSDTSDGVFLSLKTKDKKNSMSNVPLGIFLYDYAENAILLNGWEIDEDESFLQFENYGLNNNVELTIKY